MLALPNGGIKIQNNYSNWQVYIWSSLVIIYKKIEHCLIYPLIWNVSIQ
jgi:hypothetical protein